MGKYVVYLEAVAGASYTVEADSKEEAEEMARDMADGSDIEFVDWDEEAEADICEVEN